MLQRLANGQLGAEESGLAQLSRMLQERQQRQGDPSPFATQPGLTYGSSPYQQPAQQVYTPEQPTHLSGSPSPSATSYASPNPPLTRPAPSVDAIGAQPLRASPIQDMPVERPGMPGSQQTPQSIIEGIRRPDVLSRTNYGPQSQPPQQPIAAAPAVQPPSPVSSPNSTALPPLSVFTAQQPYPTPQTVYSDFEEQYQAPLRGSGGPAGGGVGREEEPKTPSITDKLNGHTTHQEQEQEDVQQTLNRLSGQGDVSDEPNLDQDAESTAKNAILLDIMQSLPPMPPASQPSGPPVLSGRATRSLGSVLLEGHLVPQSRLEVAQNVQRMLRGVDLNYQLGEILLMFKLLTPDQLLAASLVSYGLISTTQIIALGRIRQELHSIGLEYDLENLLILFRILTAEQLREVKSSWQG